LQSVERQFRRFFHNFLIFLSTARSERRFTRRAPLARREPTENGVERFALGEPDVVFPLN